LTDLAAVHLPPSPPAVLREDDTLRIEFANSDQVERGDLVLALGNPLGLKHSVTHGIISAKGRLLSSFDASEVLQTDTPINKGNSGGPPSTTWAGWSASTSPSSATRPEPGDSVSPSQQHRQEVFRQLRDKGEVERGYLGAGLLDMEPAEIKHLNLQRAGAVVRADSRERRPGRRGPYPRRRYHCQVTTANRSAPPTPGGSCGSSSWRPRWARRCAGGGARRRLVHGARER